MTAIVRTILLTLALVVGGLHVAIGAVPPTLSYQGILTDGSGTAVTGDRSITFSLYTTGTGGTAFWSETQTVTLVDGRLAVVLGKVNALDTSKFTGETWIGIKVGTDLELPRQQFSSVAYAFQAGDGGVPKGGIIMWSGAADAVPDGWALCNGQNGTPDLRNRFVVGAGLVYTSGATGGAATNILTIDEMPAHSHGGVTGAESVQHTHYDSGHDHMGTLISVNKDGTSGTRVREAEPQGPNGGVSFRVNTGWANLGPESTGHYHGISQEGRGQPLENRPPYYALAFIMKL